jgi:hypothetical protein
MSAWLRYATAAIASRPRSSSTRSGSIRFTLSYRDLEELLAERGLDISYRKSQGRSTEMKRNLRGFATRVGPAICYPGLGNEIPLATSIPGWVGQAAAFIPSRRTLGAQASFCVWISWHRAVRLLREINEISWPEPALCSAIAHVPSSVGGENRVLGMASLPSRPDRYRAKAQIEHFHEQGFERKRVFRPLPAVNRPDAESVLLSLLDKHEQQGQPVSAWLLPSARRHRRNPQVGSRVGVDLQS